MYFIMYTKSRQQLLLGTFIYSICVLNKDVMLSTYHMEKN